MLPLIPVSSEPEIIPAPLLGFPERHEIESLGHIGLFSPDDERALRRAWRILQGQTDDYLDLLLGMTAAYPALAEILKGVRAKDRHKTEDGSTALRRLFRQWLLKTCQSSQDWSWLAELYAHLLTDRQGLAEDLLPKFRYVVALAFPVAAAARPFLVTSGLDPQDIERMQYALLKAILLQVDLLSKLYVREGFW